MSASIRNCLASRTSDLRRIVPGLTEHGVHVVFVKEVLTFIGADAPRSNLLLSVMGLPPMVRPYKPQLANLRNA